MSETTTFKGFPEAGLRFLEDLAVNNNKTWFDAHKKEYERLVRDPSVGLVIALGERLQQISPNIRFDPRTNGSGSLLRINRDVRFSEDKSPYKTKVGMLFWEGSGKKTERPAFGMQIEATAVRLMAGMFTFDKPMLNRYREAVLDEELGPALVAAVDKVKAAGDYAVEGEHFKQVPRGYDRDHERADWLRYAGLWASLQHIDVKVLTSPSFVDVVMGHFQKMSPVQRWLVRI